MSDLPSREATAEALTILADTILIAPDLPIEMHAYLVLVETAQGRTSGRLVDRDTIDREALLQFLISFHRWGEVEVDRLVDFLFGASDEK